MAKTGITGSYWEIWGVHPDGTDLTQLTHANKTVTDWLDYSPDGSRLLFVGGPYPNSVGIATLPAEGDQNATAQPIPGAGNLDDAYFAATWSPDGTRIAYIGPDGNKTGIFTIPAIGGTPVEVNPPTDQQEPIGPVVWQPLPCSSGAAGCPGKPTAAIMHMRSDTDPTTVSFDGSASKASSSSANITSYHWDFGDGSPPQDGVSVTHTFSDTGAHTVTLTVSDSAGRSDTATEQLAGCQPEAVVGALHAQGCLFDDSDRWLAVGALSINGLQLAPVGRVSASLYRVRCASRSTARSRSRPAVGLCGKGRRSAGRRRTR